MGKEFLPENLVFYNLEATIAVYNYTAVSLEKNAMCLDLIFRYHDTRMAQMKFSLF